MKTILAATDFSPAAHNAAVYAVSLARIFNARLILYNAYQPILAPAIEVAVITPVQEIRDVAWQQLQKQAASLNPYSQIVIEMVLTEDNPAHGIQKVAEEYKADIIITGMKAGNKGLRKVLGSAVTAMARKTKTPVIVVPEGVKYVRLDNIAFATDADTAPDADPHILDMLMELAEKFSSKLYLIRVAKNKFREAFELLNRPFRLSKMVNTLDPVYECIEGEDVSKALNDFSREYKIDMLALVPHKHSLIERWFGKSSTRSMVFEAEIPLLILPELHKASERINNREKQSLL